MKIIDTWEDNGDKYCTVEVEENRFVEVKMPFDTPDYVYVMDCENGLEVYEKGSDKGIKNLSLEEYAKVTDLAYRKLTA